MMAVAHGFQWSLDYQGNLGFSLPLSLLVFPLFFPWVPLYFLYPHRPLCLLRGHLLQIRPLFSFFRNAGLCNLGIFGIWMLSNASLTLVLASFPFSSGSPDSFSPSSGFSSPSLGSSSVLSFCLSLSFDLDRRNAGTLGTFSLNGFFSSSVFSSFSFSSLSSYFSVSFSSFFSSSSSFFSSPFSSSVCF